MQHIGTGHTLDSADVALIDTGKIIAAGLQRFLYSSATGIAYIARLDQIAGFIYCQEGKLTGLLDFQCTLVANLIIVCIGMLTGAFGNALEGMLCALSGRICHSNSQLTGNTEGSAATIGVAFLCRNAPLNDGSCALLFQSILAQHHRMGVSVSGIAHSNHIVDTDGHAIV